MRVQGAVASLVLLGVLAGCAAAGPEAGPAATTPATAAPVADVAPVGESALPLGCADLLAASDVIDLGADFDDDVTLVVDENRIAVSMSVAELQLGALRCTWASRYAASDFHAQIDLTVAPSVETSLDAAAERALYGTFAPINGASDALVACSEGYQADDTPALYNSCQAIGLRRGYRIELDTSGLKSGSGQDPAVVISLLATITAAVDGADSPRAVEPVTGTADPASVCASPELAPVLHYLAATGDPVMASSDVYPGVSRCEWGGVDASANATGPYVSVLPGGAWAMPRLATGVSTFWVPTHPSVDGEYLVGVGDGISAWRAIGDDLVVVESWDADAQAGWEAFLASTW